jgi:gamma-glutamylcyclotransferase (GGCT)/AIG2-like uncharacterized protein YtfP
MTRRLFVYGTLRKDARSSKHHLLGPAANPVGRARTRGRLHDLGEYPGLVLSADPDAWVYGEVYELGDPAEALARLDDDEGCGSRDPGPHEFEREELFAELESGKRTRTWVYVYKGSVEGRPELTSGDSFDG